MIHLPNRTVLFLVLTHNFGNFGGNIPTTTKIYFKNLIRYDNRKKADILRHVFIFINKYIYVKVSDILLSAFDLKVLSFSLKTYLLLSECICFEQSL